MIYALDIGGTNTLFSWFSDGKAVKNGEWRTVQDKEAMLGEIIKHAPASCEGLGISTGGFWKDGRCRVYSTVEDFSDGEFLDILEKELKCPVFIDNDARCALKAEYEYGALKGHPYSALITLGSSLGCAVMLEGRIFRGYNGQGAALFLMPEIFDGRNYIYDEKINSLKITGKYKNGELYGDFYSLYKNAASGDGEAEKYIDEYITSVALKCFYLYTMFDIELIAAGGGIAENGYILNGIKDKLKKFFIYDKSDRRPVLIKAGLSDRAGITGAYLGIKEKLH